MESSSFKKQLEYVQKMHAGQTRAGNAPVWQHLLRVSTILDTALKEYKEGNTIARNLIAGAALGHDLLEDTKATKKDIEKIFGKPGLLLIEGMTNTWGDKNVRPYVAHMKTAYEAVRLIKLADLADNTGSVSVTLPLLGEKWVKKTFLPIVSPMWDMIEKSPFPTFPNTALHLKQTIRTNFANIDALLKK